MADDGLLEAVRGLHLAHPELGPKSLLAKMRERRPDLLVGNKEVREALAALKAEAEESKAPEAGRTRSSMSLVAAAVQPADQPPPPQLSVIFSDYPKPLPRPSLHLPLN